MWSLFRVRVTSLAAQLCNKASPQSSREMTRTWTIYLQINHIFCYLTTARLTHGMYLHLHSECTLTKKATTLCRSGSLYITEAYVNVKILGLDLEVYKLPFYRGSILACFYSVSCLYLPNKLLLVVLLGLISCTPGCHHVY